MAIARISIDEVEEKIIINFDIAEKEKKKIYWRQQAIYKMRVFRLASKF